MTAASTTAPRSAMGRLLDVIEVAGNKVPHPVMMFLYLIIGVIVLSQVLYLAGVSVTDEIVVPDAIQVTPDYYEDTTYPQGTEGDVLANGFHIEEVTIPITVRKVWVHLASGCPYSEVFRRAHARLSGVRPIVLRC